jgi:hypothetical protein
MKNLLENLDVIQKCLNEKNSNSLNDLMDEIRDEIFLSYDYKEDNELTREENEDKLWEGVEEEVKEYIKGTNEIPIRISIHSNWDIINSHWFENQCGYSYKDNYLQTMIDVLNLNPYKVGELLKQREYNVIDDFTNLKEREGEEKISYEDFITELENNCCGGNITFLCYVSLEDLIRKDFKLNKITIPAECICGIFNSFAGGGSVMKIETKKEIVIENNEEINFQINIDKKKDSYSFSNIYGIIESYYFKKTLLID